MSLRLFPSCHTLPPTSPSPSSHVLLYVRFCRTRSRADLGIAGGNHSEACSAGELFSHTSVPNDQVQEVRRVHELLQNWLKASSDDAGQEEARAALLSASSSPHAASPDELRADALAQSSR